MINASKYVTIPLVTFSILSCGGGEAGAEGEDSTDPKESWIIASAKDETALRVKTYTFLGFDFSDVNELELYLNSRDFLFDAALRESSNSVYEYSNSGDLYRHRNFRGDASLRSEATTTISETADGIDSATNQRNYYDLDGLLQRDRSQTYMISADKLISERETITTYYENELPTSESEYTNIYEYEDEKLMASLTLSDDTHSTIEHIYEGDLKTESYHYGEQELNYITNYYYDEYDRLSIVSRDFLDGSSSRLDFYIYLNEDNLNITLRINSILEDELLSGELGFVRMSVYEYETAESCGPFDSVRNRSYGAAGIPTCKLDRNLPSTADISL